MKFFEILSISRTKLVLLFFLKLFAGISVWLLYTYYYSAADFFLYFSDSAVLIHNLFNGEHLNYSTAWTGSFENSTFNGSRVMIILNAMLQLFSWGNFYVHLIFFCFFSFIGSVALLKAIIYHFPNKAIQAVIAIFFIPSILFWGSSPLKESIIIGIVGLLVFITDFGLRKKYSTGQIMLITLLFLLLSLLKLYVLIALAPLMLINTLVAGTSNKFLLMKYLLIFGIAGLILSALALFNDNYNILKLISDKQAKSISEAKGGVFLEDKKHFIWIDYSRKDQILISEKDEKYSINKGASFLKWDQNNMSDTTFVSNSEDTTKYKMVYLITPAKSVLKLKRLKPHLLDFIIYSPIAFLNTLIHPTVFEINSWLHLITAIENLWVILLILLAILFFDRSVLAKKEIIFFCLIFAVILFILIGITTPSIGAMVRYKTIALLFLVISCLLSIDEEKLKRILFRK